MPGEVPRDPYPSWSFKDGSEEEGEEPKVPTVPPLYEGSIQNITPLPPIATQVVPLPFRVSLEAYKEGSASVMITVEGQDSEWVEATALDLANKMLDLFEQSSDESGY